MAEDRRDPLPRRDVLGPRRPEQRGELAAEREPAPAAVEEQGLLAEPVPGQPEVVPAGVDGGEGEHPLDRPSAATTPRRAISSTRTSVSEFVSRTTPSAARVSRSDLKL